MAEGDGAGVPRGMLAHRGGGLTRMQPPDEDAFLYKHGVAGRRPLVVERERAAQPRRRPVVADRQHRLPEPPAEHHHLAHLRVRVHEIRLRQMADGLVREHARQLGVEDHGIGAAFHPGGVEQPHRPLCHPAEVGRPVLHGVPAAPQAD